MMNRRGFLGALAGATGLAFGLNRKAPPVAIVNPEDVDPWTLAPEGTVRYEIVDVGEGWYRADLNPEVMWSEGVRRDMLAQLRAHYDPSASAQ